MKRMTFLIERGILKQYTGTEAVVQIPDDVVEIGYRAFYGNHTVEQVILSNRVVKIGIQAFAECTALRDIAFTQSLRVIGHEAFHDAAWFSAQPDGIIYVGPIAWRVKGDVRNITEVSIRSGTIKLYADLFRNAAALSRVTLPDTLTEIDDRAFQNCRKLKQIHIPAQVQRIGDRAFDECTGLSVQLDSIDTVIGRYCFMPGTKVRATHLHPAKLPVNVRDSAILAFADDMCEDRIEDLIFAQTMYQYIQNRCKQYYPLAIEHWPLLQIMIQEQMIPAEDVDGILDTILAEGQADHAAALMQYKQRLTEAEETDLFDDAWDDLTLDWDLPTLEKTTVQLEQEWGMKQNSDDTYTLMRYYGTDLEVCVPSMIGDKVINAIGPYALSPVRYGINHERAEHLAQIRSVTISEGITRIGNNAFDGCTALDSVTLPKSIEQIERNAFAGCKWKL